MTWLNLCAGRPLMVLTNRKLTEMSYLWIAFSRKYLILLGVWFKSMWTLQVTGIWVGERQDSRSEMLGGVLVGRGFQWWRCCVGSHITHPQKMMMNGPGGGGKNTHRKGCQVGRGSHGTPVEGCMRSERMGMVAVASAIPASRGRGQTTESADTDLRLSPSLKCWVHHPTSCLELLESSSHLPSVPPSSCTPPAISCPGFLNHRPPIPPPRPATLCPGLWNLPQPCVLWRPSGTFHVSLPSNP